MYLPSQYSRQSFCADEHRGSKGNSSIRDLISSLLRTSFLEIHCLVRSSTHLILHSVQALTDAMHYEHISYTSTRCVVILTIFQQGFPRNIILVLSHPQLDTSEPRVDAFQPLHVAIHDVVLPAVPKPCKVLAERQALRRVSAPEGAEVLIERERDVHSGLARNPGEGLGDVFRRARWEAT